MIDLLKEAVDFYRFFWGTQKDEKEIVFYAEHREYYPYLEGVIRELIDKYSQALSYITSDGNDTILRGSQPKMKTFYLNRLLPIFMVFVNCKVFVMTLTDLNQFHLKRSIYPVHYVYVFHSLVSTHMIYRAGAFNHYDSILCTGSYQIKEIRKYEELHNLNPKSLIEAGYYRLEELYKMYKGYNKEDDKVTILVAPTWGTSNLLNWCGKELIELLLDKGYDVILRLHPETVKRHRFHHYKNVVLETSVANLDSLVKADIIITDWSGIGLKYAFGTERPVIFIDTPPKIHNPQYQELGIEPIEASLRDRIGIIVSLKDIGDIPSVIQNSLRDRVIWKDRLSMLRSEYVFNFGGASEIGAAYIKGLL